MTQTTTTTTTTSNHTHEEQAHLTLSPLTFEKRPIRRAALRRHQSKISFPHNNNSNNKTRSGRALRYTPDDDDDEIDSKLDRRLESRLESKLQRLALEGNFAKHRTDQDIRHRLATNFKGTKDSDEGVAETQVRSERDDRSPAVRESGDESRRNKSQISPKGEKVAKPKNSSRANAPVEQRTGRARPYVPANFEVNLEVDEEADRWSTTKKPESGPRRGLLIGSGSGTVGTSPVHVPQFKPESRQNAVVLQGSSSDMMESIRRYSSSRSNLSLQNSRMTSRQDSTVSSGGVSRHNSGGHEFQTFGIRFSPRFHTRLADSYLSRNLSSCALIDESEAVSISSTNDPLAQSNPTLVAEPSPSTFGSRVPSGLGISSTTLVPPEPPVWQEDDDGPICTNCECEFVCHRRRHHCRLCLKIFCGTCSQWDAPLDLLSKFNNPAPEPVRVKLAAEVKRLRDTQGVTWRTIHKTIKATIKRYPLTNGAKNKRLCNKCFHKWLDFVESARAGEEAVKILDFGDDDSATRREALSPVVPEQSAWDWSSF